MAKIKDIFFFVKLKKFRLPVPELNQQPEKSFLFGHDLSIHFVEW